MPGLINGRKGSTEILSGCIFLSADFFCAKRDFSFFFCYKLRETTCFFVFDLMVSKLALSFAMPVSMLDFTTSFLRKLSGKFDALWAVL